MGYITGSLRTIIRQYQTDICKFTNMSQNLSQAQQKSHKSVSFFIAKIVLYTLVIIKILLVTKTVIRRNFSKLPKVVHVNSGLGDSFDMHSETFQILNRENVSWILSPRFECEDEKLLLLISS